MTTLERKFLEGIKNGKIELINDPKYPEHEGYIFKSEYDDAVWWKMGVLAKCCNKSYKLHKVNDEDNYLICPKVKDEEIV